MAKKINQEIIDNSKIIDCNIETVLHNSMIPYSEHVILDRALPRVEDGLKPVQRRILFTMLELGILPDKPHRKSARIVGDCLGKYHPHGDRSIYDAMVRLAQNYNIRMPLVDGHGNFGSVDGDNAAAMRYTEARLTPLALELLRDLNKDTVPMALNFDDSLEEPEILPGRFPNLLVNGASGIAVGLATNIPPHNLGEVIDGVIAYIDNPRITLKEMMKHIPAPDFPTGGLIVDNEEIKKSYETGKGRIVMRAKAFIENENGKDMIVITEIPYQINKSTLLQNISALRETKKELFGCISDVVDESDRNGMRCVIKLRKDADAKFVLNALYKNTNMECGFSVNTVAIAEGRPQQLTLLEIISYYVEHQRNIIYRRSQYDLIAAKRRAHILEGLLIAVHNIREVVEIVLTSKTYTESKERLKTRFSLSEKQAIAVLDVPLKRLNKLDIGKMEEELARLKLTIKELELILASKKRQLQVVRNEIAEIKRKYNSPRRSKVLGSKDSQEIVVDMSQVERSGVIVLNYNGNLKFLNDKTYKQALKSIVNCSQHTFAKQVIAADSKSNYIAFTKKGNAIVFSGDSLEDDKWNSKGKGAGDLGKVDVDDVIISVMPTKHFDNQELIFYTQNGMIKKSATEEYQYKKLATYQAIVLKEDDYVIGVEMVDPACEFTLLVSQKGMCLNAENGDVPRQGRKSGGVRGMQLADGDKVIFAKQNENVGEIVVISENGYGKRVVLPTIEPTKRYRKGVVLCEVGKKSGIIYIGYVTQPYLIGIVMPDGVSCELNTDDISIEARTAKGKNILKLLGGQTNAMVIGKCFENNLLQKGKKV